MTCIAAWTDGKRVTVGGDSAGVGGYSLTVRADTKVFVKNEMAFGFTTSFRMGQLLRYSLDAKLPDDSKQYGSSKLVDTPAGLVEWMSTTFIDRIRECLKAGGFAKMKDNREEGGCFIIGVRGQIMTIFGDYQIGLPTYPFDSVGCGFELALGSMHHAHDDQRRRKTAGETIVCAALGAAESFSAGVRGPFHVVSVGGL